MPLKLPDMERFEPGDDPQGCLARAADWRYFEKDGKWYARETNTMPQWAGSCWYYLRFIDPKNNEKPWSTKADEDWMPVDLYIGGQEHATLHLLYSRFWHKVLFELGLTRVKEPFQKLVHQGMILGADGEKMSKSRGNVVNPDDVVGEHGADALRLYEMFMGPLEATKPWQTEQVSGVVRFRDKVHALASRPDLTDEMPEKVERAMHKTIKKVTEDIENLALNTAISALMVFTNTLQDAGKEGKLPKKGVETLCQLASPFAPHLGEECWQILGNPESIAYEPWPQFDEKLCEDSTVSIGVQVNGKLRGQLEIAKDAPEDEAKSLALALPRVAEQCDGKEVKKFIYRPGKIVNIVVGGGKKKK
uniref:leucine--tRNA ligase n=1 Tax=Amorphochlora amoebiformis TaxID=1561963 RepID=A0A7S0DVS4_9EUKA